MGVQTEAMESSSDVQWAGSFTDNTRKPTRISSLVHSESATVPSNALPHSPFRSYQLPQQNSAPENMNALIAAVQPCHIVIPPAVTSQHERPVRAVLSTFQHSAPAQPEAEVKAGNVTLSPEKTVASPSFSDADFAPLLAQMNTDDDTMTSATQQQMKRNSLNPFPLSPVDVPQAPAAHCDVTDQPPVLAPVLLKEMSDYDNLSQQPLETSSDVITTPTNESAERLDQLNDLDSDSDTLSTASVEREIFAHLNKKRESLTSTHSSNDRVSLVLVDSASPSMTVRRNTKHAVSFNPYDTSNASGYFGNFSAAPNKHVTSAQNALELSRCVQAGVDGLRQVAAAGGQLQLRPNSCSSALDETTIWLACDCNLNVFVLKWSYVQTRPNPPTRALNLPTLNITPIQL